MTWFRYVSVAITSVGLFGCVVFVVAYWWRSHGSWRREEAGRFLMVVYINLAFLFGLVIAGQLFGDWRGRRVVTTIVYSAYAVEAWWPLRLLIRARTQKSAPKEQAAE